MRTIAIINQKGGCGKTTVAINLAAVLAAGGHRTLLVDMDPQSHCALGLAVPSSRIDHCLAHVLRAGMDGTIGIADIIWQVSRHFDLAPSSIALAGIEQELAGAPDRDRRLAQVLAPVADRYDFCVIDCPPSIGLITFNALRACDEVLIPVETGYFALQGAIKQQATLEMLARRINHVVRAKVLATMYDVRTKLAREILGELRRQFGQTLLPVVVNFNAKLKEAASFGQPITEYDPASRGMQDFEELATWLLANPPAAPVEADDTALPAAAGSQGPVATPAPVPSPAQAATGNPALSRAAELVERARALAARTAALSARLSHDPDIRRELGPGHAPATPGNGNGTAQPPGLATPIRQTVPTSASIEPLMPAAPLSRSRGVLTLDTSPGDDDAIDRGPLSATINVQNEKVRKLYGVRATPGGLVFVQPANLRAREVAIAGDFNGWDPRRTPLTRNEGLDVWQAVVRVPPGRYRYRLVLDGQWVQDPYNTYVESNPFGELNNVIETEE